MSRFVKTLQRMEATQIRQKLHQYIDNSNEKLLKLMVALAKHYKEGHDFEYKFTTDDIAGFDKPREKCLKSESKTYNWNEARKIIIQKTNTGL